MFMGGHCSPRENAALGLAARDKVCAMDNRKVITVVAVSSLLAAECAEIVHVPEKQPTCMPNRGLPLGHTLSAATRRCPLAT
jgi:hypothetical protein